MESNVSTVAFRSNLYPVEKSFYEDSTFRWRFGIGAELRDFH